MVICMVGVFETLVLVFGIIEVLVFGIIGQFVKAYQYSGECLQLTIFTLNIHEL